MRNGPRDLEAVLASRYWLTEKGEAAAETYLASQADETEQDS